MKQITSYKIPLLTFALLSLPQAAAHAQQAVTDLGTLGGTYSEGYHISNDGSLIFGSSETAGGDTPAFIWDNGMMTSLGMLAGGTYSYIYKVSADGSIVVGSSETAGGDYHAFIWENGVTTDLGTLGGSNSTAYAVSNDGSVVVGSSFTAGGNYHAFRWTGGVMTDLGTIGADTDSQAVAISASGNVIVGSSLGAGGGSSRAFRWESGVMTDLMIGGTWASAVDVSADGNIVIGTSSNFAGVRSFRWQGGSSINIGNIGDGSYTYASRISANGNVIIGTGRTASSEFHAFRWMGGVMTDLGTLDGSNSGATALTSDGSVIVGYSDVANGDRHAVFWKNGTIKDLNTLAGDLGGFDYLSSAEAVSDNGTFITGTGNLLNGDQHAYLFNVSAAAVATPDEISRALTPVAAAPGMGRAMLGSHIAQALSVARNARTYFPSPVSSSAAPRKAAAALSSANPADIEPAAGGDDFVNSIDLPDEKRHAFFAVGSYGLGAGDGYSSTRNASGMAGILVKSTDQLSIGVGAIGSHSTQDTAFGGNTTIDAKGAAMLASWVPQDRGLSIFGSAAFAVLDTDSTRAYVTGGPLSSSSGSTSGTAWGVVARAGYTMPLGDTLQLMPYGEGEVSGVSLDGYTETGGSFPAAIGKQRADSYVSRLGAEVSHTLSEQWTLRSRAAWGHRYGDADVIGVSVSALSFQMPSGGGDRNWAEGGVSATYRLNDAGATLIADVTGHTGETDAAVAEITTGITVPF